MPASVVKLLDKFTYVAEESTDTTTRFPWFRIPSDCRAAEIQWGCSAYMSGSATMKLETSMDGVRVREAASQAVSAITTQSSSVSMLAPLVRMRIDSSGAAVEAGMTLFAYLVLKTAHGV